MALGNTSLDKIYGLNEEIEKAIDFGNEQSNSVYSTWNTFQYVAKNLSVWADETTIGAETKQQMQKLANNLYDLMNATISLKTKVDNFISGQRSLNSNSSLRSKYRIVRPNNDDDSLR